jgi:hypothetical protein
MLRHNGGAHKKSGDPVTATTRLALQPAVYDRALVMSTQLPEPRLTKVYRLEATLAEPTDLGDISQGHRRIVALTGGTFTGPELNGELLAGASADWQIILPDGTALGDIRYTLRTDRGDLLYVQSRSIRHGSADVLARPGKARTSMPASTPSARRPRSRPRLPTSTGSTRASSSASAAGGPEA